MQNDQAAGLRRLFRAAPPRVVGLVPCSASVMPWVVRQMQARVRESARILALDEWGNSGNLADSLLISSSRFDLLQAVEGSVSVKDCLIEVERGFELASVSRLAMALGADRMVNQRVLGLFKNLQQHFDEWIVVARAADANGVSRLLQAVPDVVLLADAKPESIFSAYATLKQLSELNGLSVASIVLTQFDVRGSYALANNLERVVREQLGMKLNFVMSLEEALAVESFVSVSDGPEKFLERLLIAVSSPARRVVSRRSQYALCELAAAPK